MKLNFQAALIATVLCLSRSSQGVCMEDLSPCEDKGRPTFQRPTHMPPLQGSIQKTTPDRRKSRNPKRALPTTKVPPTTTVPKTTKVPKTTTVPKTTKVRFKLFGDSDTSDTSSQTAIPRQPTYAPKVFFQTYNVGTWADFPTHLLNTTTNLVVDFDGTLARRVYTIPLPLGESLTIRYAASEEWNSPMYERFFNDALKNLKRTTGDFGQIFQYFESFISYEILDKSFSTMDLSKIPHKRVLSCLKDNDGKKSSLSGKSGFSYHDSEKNLKPSKIAQFLREDKSITHIIFVGNHMMSIQNMEQNLRNMLASMRYKNPTNLHIDFVHFNYFERKLTKHPEILLQDIRSMFGYVEHILSKRLHPSIGDIESCIRAEDPYTMDGSWGITEG